MVRKKILITGGLLKSVNIPAAMDPGTTITGYGGQSISVAQLKQLLGVVTAPPNTQIPTGSNPGGGGSLSPSFRPSPALLYRSSEDGERGDIGPPGKRGLQGIQGIPGTGGGGTASKRYIVMPTVEEIQYIPVPGKRGLQGIQGVPGTGGSGKAKMFPWMRDEIPDIPMFVGRATGGTINTAADYTWTGSHQFNRAYTGVGTLPVSLNSSNPAIAMRNTSATTDQKLWIFNVASNGTFVLYAVNDAESTFSPAFGSTRTAGVLKTVDLGNSTDNPIVTANGRPILNITPDTHPATANASDDEFEGATLNLTTKWTWRQQNTAVQSLKSGSLLIASELNAASVINAIDEALPSGNCTFDIKAGVYVPASGNFSAPIFLLEAATGKAMSLGIFNSGSLFLVSVAGTLSGGWATNPVANAGAPSYYASAQVLPSPQGYWRVQISGSNMLWFMSSDGLIWWPYGTFALTSFFTTAPDRIGFSVQPGSATAVAQLSADWIRRVA